MRNIILAGLIAAGLAAPGGPVAGQRRAEQPAMPAGAEGTGPAVPGDRLCVVNASPRGLFFAVETREGARRFAALEPGERLCTEPTGAADGIVSVFEDADGFEGCSRIVPVGTAEQMRRYAEFDRCLWGSHGG